jgi:hypothetical protein
MAAEAAAGGVTALVGGVRLYTRRGAPDGMGPVVLAPGGKVKSYTPLYIL